MQPSGRGIRAPRAGRRVVAGGELPERRADLPHAQPAARAGPLEPDDIKPRLLGHWGTSPGLNLVYAHLNRAIVERGTPTLYVCGPGTAAPRWSRDDVPRAQVPEDSHRDGALPAREPRALALGRAVAPRRTPAARRRLDGPVARERSTRRIRSKNLQGWKAKRPKGWEKAQGWKVGKAPLLPFRLQPSTFRPSCLPAFHPLLPLVRLDRPFVGFSIERSLHAGSLAVEEVVHDHLAGVRALVVLRTPGSGAAPALRPSRSR